MKRGLLLLLLTFCAGTSAAQMKGKFYLPKQSYASGEPVVLYFEVTNNSQKPFNILHANPYTPCSGFEIRLSSTPSKDSYCKPQGRAGSCASSNITLRPGQTRTENIVLNYEHEIGLPGDYEIVASRRLPYSRGQIRWPQPDAIFVRNRLRFRVETSRVDPAVLQRLARELNMSRPNTNHEVALTLASIAPQELEDTLLQFANDPKLVPYAPLAFHRLNTPRSMAALAELLIKSRPGSPEHHSSARYLGESGDPQWFPILREFALRNPNDGTYAYPAAQTGGDTAVKLFTELMRRSHNGVPVSALAYTGSRKAIPVLLDLLKGEDTNNAERAVYALEQLTHLKSESSSRINRPQAQYNRWSAWWEHSGASARIYRSNECGDFARIP